MAFSLIHSGARAGQRQVADVIAKSAGFNHFRGRQQQTAVVHAGAAVQDRWNTDNLTDFSQAGTAVNRRAFRGQQAFHGTGNAVTAGGQDEDVIFDQFLDHRDMGFIVTGAGIVAPHHGANAPNTAVDECCH